MTHTQCTHILDKLDDYRRQTLPEADAAVIAGHLAGCQSCAAELKFREDLGLALRASVPAAMAPTYLSAAIKSALHADSDSGAVRPAQSALLPWMMAAAILLITFIGFYQVNTDRDEVASAVLTERRDEVLAPVEVKSETVLAPADSAVHATPEAEISREVASPAPMAAGAMSSKAAEYKMENGYAESASMPAARDLSLRASMAAPNAEPMSTLAAPAAPTAQPAQRSAQQYGAPAPAGAREQTKLHLPARQVASITTATEGLSTASLVSSASVATTYTISPSLP